MAKIELETRVCKCGCGFTWRCLPTSPNRYYSATHDPEGPPPSVAEWAYIRKVRDWIREKCGEEHGGPGEGVIL